MPRQKRWSDGSPFLYDLAMAVRAGHNTLDKLRQVFRDVHSETVANAARQLSDTKYLTVESIAKEGGGKINLYRVRIMPPEPLDSAPRMEIKPHVTELERVWPMPVALPRAKARYVKRPVGPI